MDLLILHSNPTYPLEMSFVLKLHRDVEPANGLIQGRIEHVPSRLRREFRGVLDLQRQMAQLLEGIDAGRLPSLDASRSSLPSIF